MRKNRSYIAVKYLILFPVAFFFTLSIFGNEPCKEIIYLSGTDNTNTKTWDFFCTKGRKSGYWTTIEVPSHWEQQGFGNYDFGRNYITYGNKYKYNDEQGLYRYKFQIPEHLKGRNINIVFEGSMTDTEVKINGKSVGDIHQGSFYCFRYDISKYLIYGDSNLLEVTVSKMSSNRSVNAAERYADYWIFGGIFRPVYLEVFPGEYIERAAINAKANGYFSMDVFPKNLESTKTIEATITDSNGKIISQINQKAKPGDSIINLNAKIAGINPWNQELPTLYKVKVILKNSKKTVYSLVEKFGFRTIEIRKEDGIYINGTKVKMKGINRHAFWPETGRCLNNKINLTDVKLIKEMNMNAVRCSHYPPDKIFLDYCDSLGLYVIDELAGWQNAYDTKTGTILVKEMVTHDVNHPSVIFWANGNEGGHNKELDDDYAIYDPSNRPVIHAHHRPGNAFNGIDCNHYEDYYSSKELLKGPNIYMPTEFLHGQNDGGSAAGLNDFWEMFWKEKLSGGGFLWAMLDEGIVRTDLNGYIDVNLVNAPDGVMGPHREKEASFYAIREIYSPVKINMDELPENFTGKIKLENRFHFTNLKQCKFKCQLANFKHPADRLAGFEIKDEISIESPDITPLNYGNLEIKLPADWKKYDVLLLLAYSPNGDEILKWDWQIKSNKEIIQPFVKWEQGEVAIKEKADTLELTAGDISLELSKKDATIIGVRNKSCQSISFTKGPVLVGETNSELISFNHFKSDSGYVVEAKFKGNLNYIRWTMNASGWLKMDYEYSMKGSQNFSGVTFNYPESNIIGVKWLGNGPYRVWKNRMQGGNLDVFEAMYNNTVTGLSPWIYPEFKGYYSDIVWMEFNTVEGKFLIAANENDLFVRLFDFYSIPGPENHPDLPGGDISFLDGIPPTGTKLWINISPDASRNGPSGELFTMNKPIKRTLYFYFGLPEE